MRSRKNVRVFERYFVGVEAKYPDAPDKLKFNEALKRMLNRFVTDLIENTKSRVAAIGRYESGGMCASIRNGWLAFSPEVELERREAKAFLYKTLYDSKPLLPEKLKAEKVVTETFDYLVAHPEALPPSYQEKVSAREASARGVRLHRRHD